VGGKLTTHRAMAQDVVDLAARRLGRPAAGHTAQVPLDEGVRSPADAAALVEAARAAAVDLDDETLRYLVQAYGSRCLEVLLLATARPELNRRLVDGLPYLWAEAAYAVNAEMAGTLNDVLIRRLHLIHEDREQGLPQAAGVAALIGPALGWDGREIERQVEAYRREVALTHQFDAAWRLPS
jgi:glycerol-3-phosphate dehydrogenase